MTLGVIFGADSELFSRRTLEYMQELIPEPFLIKEIANAQHHLFLDQPQAFVESLLEMCQKF
jgi:pimeloyl-ACP methyl ester carboxylesterase